MFVGDDADAPSGAVVDEGDAPVPIHVLGRLRTARHTAPQVDVAAAHHVDLTGPAYVSLCLCRLMI